MDALGHRDCAKLCIVNGECNCYILLSLEDSGKSDILFNFEDILCIVRNNLFTLLPSNELVAGFRSSLNGSVCTNSDVATTGNSTLILVAGKSNLSSNQYFQFKQSGTVRAVTNLDISAVVVNLSSINEYTYVG